MADQASFIRAREPSIWGWENRKHYVAPVRKHLLNEILENENPPPRRQCISTYLRLRPIATAAQDQATFSILNETTVVAHAPKDSVTFKIKVSGRVGHQFTFSKVFGQSSSQKEIFDECVAYQIKDFILGNNCLMFAYGTTNAGKTFTIQGNSSNPGIIPRSLDLLFKSIRGQVAGVGRYKPDKVEGIIQLDSATIAQELDYKNRILLWSWDKPLEPIKSGLSISPDVSRSSESDFISSTFREMQKTLSSDSPIDNAFDVGVVYGVWVSFAEVYNESIFDLLDPIATRNRKRIPLKMAQDSEGNTFIRDLRMIHVASGDEAFHVMLYGKANLQVAATNMNMHSSRSHCIFTIRLVRYANSNNPSHAIVSTFTFCDLAGAERAKKTLNIGDRLKESNNINTSLTVLGRCLSTIRENQKRNEKKPVPFRDSKLTRIFQRALTGHERITMIVNANTSPGMFDETLNVLNFSAMAKQVVLETPIKRSKPAIKKSRFSLLVSRPNQHGTICWDAPSEEEEDHNSQQSRKVSDNSIQQYNAQNGELLMLVEKLKEKLAQEHLKNVTLESKIREEVTDTFSKVISNMEDSWKARLKDVEERNESLSAWRITQLENYYQQQLESSRKRRRKSDLDDSIVECISPEKDEKIKDLEDEIQLLNEKCSALHQLLKEAQDIQASVSAENSSLKFELANVNVELENTQRQVQALRKEDGPEAHTQELECQLNMEKQKTTEEMKKNASLKELLDEAKQDFLLLNKEKEEADTENIKLQNELVEKEDELIIINGQLEEAQLLLTQKSRDFDKVEDKYEELLKIHDLSEGRFKEINEVLKEYGQTIEAAELQRQLQSLSMSPESSPDPACQSDVDSGKTLLSLTSSLSDFIKTKLEHAKKSERDFELLKSQLNETLENLRCKDLEVESLTHKVESLEKQLKDSKCNSEGKELNEIKISLQEKLDAINNLENEKMSLVNELSLLKDQLSESTRLKHENVSRINQQQEEIKLLQKDIKDLLQKNIKSEQYSKETLAELDRSKDNCHRLELELKSVLQKSTSILNMSSSSQIELESLRSKEKSHEDTIKFFRDWKEEASRETESIKKQLKECQEENQRREEELKSKEVEVETIHAHRGEIISRYEEALKKVQEELEREKREVIRLRDALYKSTPTPKKNDSAEIRQLRDRVETLQTELNLRIAESQSSAKTLTKSAKKINKQESFSSNESLKEYATESHVVPASASKSKRTTSSKDVSNSSSKRETVKESCTAPPAPNEQKTKRRYRKLLYVDDSYACEGINVEQVEVECQRTTTPDGFVKRSLRNRKV